jgi:hypothetical protein
MESEMLPIDQVFRTVQLGIPGGKIVTDASGTKFAIFELTS